MIWGSSGDHLDMKNQCFMVLKQVLFIFLNKQTSHPRKCKAPDYKRILSPFLWVAGMGVGVVGDQDSLFPKCWISVDIHGQPRAKPSARQGPIQSPGKGQVKDQLRAKPRACQEPGQAPAKGQSNGQPKTRPRTSQGRGHGPARARPLFYHDRRVQTSFFLEFVGFCTVSWGVRCYGRGRLTVLIFTPPRLLQAPEQGPHWSI